MNAVILAAGKSSRFYPYSHFSHKSLITIMGKPIIEHTVLSLKKAGIREVIVVVGKGNSVQDILGDGRRLGVEISYCVQEEPLGQGHALLKAQAKIKGDFYLLHAHRVDFFEFGREMMKKQKKGEVVLLARKKNTVGRYGVLKVREDVVEEVVEKPSKGEEPSRLRVIGIYLLNKDFLEVLSKTSLEHYNLEKALDLFSRTGKVKVVITSKPSYSLKYPWDLLSFKNYLFGSMKRHISKKAIIAKSTEIIGKVHIEDGANILEGAVIRGPCYIGKQVMVGNNSLIRDWSDIEERSRIGAYMEVKNSLILNDSTTHSGFIGDSIIGKDCKLGAQFICANVRLDRKQITVAANNKKIETNLKSLGVFMGDNVRVGNRVSIIPGVIIGNNVTIGPSTTVMKNIEDNVSYFTTFKQHITKKKI